MPGSRLVRSVTLVAIAFAVAACGDFTSSTSPASSASSGLTPPTKTIAMAFAMVPDNARATALRWGGSHDPVTRSVSALISAEGGSLSLPGSDFRMVIPQGAVAEGTFITVTSLQGEYVAFDMQPHGLRFLKPVQVVQGLRNTASYGTAGANGVRSAYLTEGNERIRADGSASPAELLAGVTLFYGPVPVAETHVWYLDHFSRYILISGVWTCVKDC